MSQQQDGTQQREWLWLACIVSVGVSLKISAAFLFNHVPESDELAYKSTALNLVNGNGIVDSMGNRAMFNVGYPLFVLAPVFFFNGENIFAARLANIFLGGVTILLCYLVAKEAGAGGWGNSSRLPSGRSTPLPVCMRYIYSKKIR